MSITAKSVIFDIANDYGGSYTGVRSIDFYLDGSLIDMPYGDYTAYGTSTYGAYQPYHAFNTDEPKTGSSWDPDLCVWLSSSSSPRLVIVFDSEQTFDEIVVNNYHNEGGATNNGIKDVVISISPDTITSTTYNANISNGYQIFDGSFDEHVSSDVLDSQSYLFSWSLSFVNYTGSMSPSAQLNDSRNDIFLNTDGSKLYIQSYYDSGNVYQYSLSTDWDISTASYASKSLDLSNESTTNHGFFMSPDGSKLYSVSSGDNKIYQYSLSTDWDLSTASYASKYFLTSSYLSTPVGMFINSDGTKLYIQGQYGSCYQFTLSTAWDISTASSDSKSFTLGGYDDVFWDLSGKTLFGCGGNNVYEYPVSTAWDISTAGSVANTYNTNSYTGGSNQGMFIKPDGNVLYVTGSNKLITQYNMVTPTVVIASTFETITSLSISDIPIIQAPAFENITDLSTDLSFNINTIAFDNVNTLDASIFIGVNLSAPAFENITDLSTDISLNINTTAFNNVNTLSGDMIYSIISTTFENVNTLSLNSINNFKLKFSDVYYIFTLTGAANGTTDIEIPITSFQCSMRNDNPTFLQVVVPSMDYADEITNRSDGTIKIDMAYKKDNNFILRETIVEADLEDIIQYKGMSSQSIALNGYKTETYSNKSITLPSSNYRSIENGKYRHRLSQPNISLRPGDTVTISGDTFVANVITYYISVENKTMEISEE